MIQILQKFKMNYLKNCSQKNTKCDYISNSLTQKINKIY